MPANLATPGFLKIKVFWNKFDDVLISVYYVTKKILLFESNQIADAVMLPRFGNSSISMREVILNFLRIWPEKQVFLRVGTGLSII